MKTTQLRKLYRDALAIAGESSRIVHVLRDMIHDAEDNERHHTPRPPAWSDKANPVNVVAWISTHDDGVAIADIRREYRLTERQWLKLRTTLLDAGCVITGNTNRRTVHAPGGIHAAHD